jgi:hypothetical protein
MIWKIKIKEKYNKRCFKQIDRKKIIWKIKIKEKYIKGVLNK